MHSSLPWVAESVLDRPWAFGLKITRTIGHVNLLRRAIYWPLTARFQAPYDRTDGFRDRCYFPVDIWLTRRAKAL